MSKINACGNILAGSVGSGAYVGSISATLTSPDIGTPIAGVLTNCVGLPLTTGVTGNLSVNNLNSGIGANSISFWRGDGTWAAIASMTVTTITGTANQVLVNGFVGVPIDGVVTLTTPQDIAPTSSPTFASLTLTSPLSLTNGGSNNSLSASNGGVVYSDATKLQILSGTVTANQMLQSGSSSAPTWSSSVWPASTTINQILYSSSANTVTGLSTQNSAILYTNSSGVPALSVSMTNGQLMIGSTGASPSPANLSAGTGITITNAANSITVSSTGGGSSWTVISGTSQSASPDNGYISNNAGLVTLTLPSTASVGTVVRLVGLGAGGWKIAQNAGQNIQIGSLSSTVGAGGSVASTNRYDSVNLLCVVANTTWVTMGAPQSSGLTVV